MRQVGALAMCCAAVAVSAAGASPTDRGIDCAKARSALERRICADPKLRKAEAEMSTAYFRLLRSIEDRDMRDALVMSQRRWIKAREESYGFDDESLRGEDADIKPTELLSRAVARRRARLSARTKDGIQSEIVRDMEKEKTFFARTSGGPFQGYRLDCSFGPLKSGEGFACEGTMLLQWGQRVCGTDLQLASGHESQYNVVANVVGGKLSFRASCRDGYAGLECPADVLPRTYDAETDKDGRQWNRAAGESNVDLPTAPVAKLDPDAPKILNFSDAALDRCLTEGDYPDPPRPTQADSPARSAKPDLGLRH